MTIVLDLLQFSIRKSLTKPESISKKVLYLQIVKITLKKNTENKEIAVIEKIYLKFSYLKNKT